MLIGLNRGYYEPIAFVHEESFAGKSIFPLINLTCLTPDARATFATSVEPLPGFNIWMFAVNWVQMYEITLMQLELGDGRKPLEPGVHLFGLSILENYQSLEGPIQTALATAIIRPQGLKVFDSTTETMASWLLAREKAGKEEKRPPAP